MLKFDHSVSLFQNMIPTIASLLLLFHSVTRTAYSQSENSGCSRQDYNHCVKMADPLLKDPRLIFPDNQADIDTLCSSHLRFRECILEETKRQCDKGSSSGSATRFSRQMLDKALSFLRDQCYNYIPTTGECPGLSVLSNPYNGHDESTSNSNTVPDQQHRPSNHQPYSPDGTVHPWHHHQGTGSNHRGMNTPEAGTGAAPWMPNGNNANSTGYQTSSSRDGGQSSDTTISRSSHTSDTMPPAQSTSTFSTAGGQVPNRSPSYGRGITWSTSSNTQTSGSDFGSNTWHVTSNGGVSNTQHPTEPWYPAVSNYGGGSYSGNAVDEPNQQGLSNNNNNNNNGAKKSYSKFSLLIMLSAIAILN
ncbi:hypothetical protein C0J52_15647 [Blattella germanica]|nr:hypothetical protein C0J52_15647 [Blattella germanica]